MIKLTAAEAQALYDHGGDWDGERQGEIFKSIGAFQTGNDVCYLPDYDLHFDEEGMEGYTREDFIEEAGGNLKRAEILFDGVTWENPEAWVECSDDETNWGICECADAVIGGVEDTENGCTVCGGCL